MDTDPMQSELERRRRQVMLATQVAQAIAGATSLDELYQRVVVQIKEQFHYYYTQLLRVNTTLQAVVLVAGYGTVGERLRAAGYKVPLGQGFIGRVAATGESILSLTVADDPLWQPTPFLPDTKSALVVPVKLGDQVLGVLDVQTDVCGLLDGDDQLMLEGICGQIAIAIDTTRLRQEMEIHLRRLSTLQRLTSYEDWMAHTQSITGTGYLFDQDALHPITPTQLQSPTADPLKATQPNLVVQPMIVHGQRIGGLGVYDDPDNPLSEDDRLLLEQITVQAAEALERARLMEQTQLQTVRAVKHEQYQRSVARVATILTQQGTATLSQTLAILGQTTRSARVTYFETIYHNQQPYWRQAAQWLDPKFGITVPDNPVLQQFPVSDAPYLALTLQTDGQLAGPIKDLPLPEQGILNISGVQSMLCLSVPGSYATPGFLEFDDLSANRPWDEEEIATLQTAAAALANTLVLEDTLRRMETNLAETEALYRVSRAIGEAETLEETVLGAAEIAISLNLTSCTITLFTQFHQTGIPTAGDLYRVKIVEGEFVSLPVVYNAELWDQQAALKIWRDPSIIVFYPDVDDPTLLISDSARNYLEQNQLRSMILVGLKVKNQPKGFLIYTSTQSLTGFTEKNLNHIRTVADQVMVRLENRRLLAETQTALTELAEQARRPALLNEMNRRLASITDEEQIMMIATTYAAKIVPADMMGVSLLLHDQQSLEFSVFERGERVKLPNTYLSLDDSLAGTVIQQNMLALTEQSLELFTLDVAVIPDVTVLSGRDMVWAAGQGILSVMVVPLLVGSEVIGTLNVGCRKLNAYTPNDENFIIQIAVTVSSIIQNRRLLHQIQQSLALTKNLYNLSRRINAAESIDNILEVLMTLASVSSVDRMLLFTVDQATDNTPAAVTVAAAWHSSDNRIPMPVGTHYTLSELAEIGLALDGQIRFLEDISTASHLTAEARLAYQELAIEAMAVLPLLVGSRQIGALVLISPVPHQFNDTEMQPYLSVNSQVAVTVENYRLLAETRAALHTVETTQRRYTVQAWQDYRLAHPTLAYQKVRSGAEPISPETLPQVEQALSGQQTVVINPAAALPNSAPTQPAAVVVPLTVRNQTIGVLGLQETNPVHPWTADEIALIEAIASEFSQAAEELRLLDETQQRAAREQIIRQITEKMQMLPDVESILNTGGQELVQLMGGTHTLITLDVPLT